VPDGWAANPDYIVLFAKGLWRYDLDSGKYAEREFGGYVVLKVLK
jgi:hypothetical protein